MLEFARRLLVDLNLHTGNVTPWSEYSGIFLLYSIFWLIIFFLIQFIYYKILLYIIYGKSLPK